MKSLKKLLVLILSIATVCCVCAFVGCGDTQPKELTFTITVVNEQNEAVEGANVVVCSKTDGACDIPVKTDSNGVVTVTKENGEYAVHVAPSTLYEESSEYDLNASNTAVTIVLVTK